MCPKPSIIKFSLKQRARGFSLVAAIFLLVIMSALGAFMLSISTMQQTTSTQDLQGSKAYQAAKAGIEWGAYQTLTSATLYTCIGSKVLPALGGALKDFTVTVNCTSSDFIEAGNTVRVYQFTSTAVFGAFPSPNFISRSMSASINVCRIGMAPSPLGGTC
jgi:MSHA biogenesis protein MshP